MSEMTWVPPLLLTIRGLCHLLIFLRVASYTADHSFQRRKTVGIFAAIFAGANLAESIRISSNFSTYPVNFEPYLPIVMIFLLAFVTWSGGNIARLFPRNLLEKLP